jgi:hypothetical protein
MDLHKNAASWDRGGKTPHVLTDLAPVGGQTGYPGDVLVDHPRFPSSYPCK